MVWRRSISHVFATPHAYDVIDDSIIHGVATLDLPRLRDALAVLLGEFHG